RELADRLDFDFVLDFRVETLGDEDLAVGSLVREPRCEVRHGADRCAVEAAFEPDLAARGVAERKAGAESELIAPLSPPERPFCHLLAQRAAESYRAQRSIGNLDGVVEEELDTVPLDESDRCVEAPHELADCAVELREHAHQLLRLHRVDKTRPTAQIGEE